MIGKISILGHIGDSYVDEKGMFHKGTTLLDVIEQAESLPEQVAAYEVSINSPGGYVEVGDAIVNYLNSLKKKGKQLITVQDGLVGSIATKIFLTGDKRIVDDRYQFFIHNPFAKVEGDQDELRLHAAQLEQTENDLRAFYAQFTKITDDGLNALMKQETGLTADQCVKFGFATEKKKAPVFNIIKTKMKNEDKSLKEQILAILGVKNESKGIAPKAAMPPKAMQPKSMVINLADGAGSFWVEAEAIAEGVSAFLLDANGQPTAEALPDGDYALEDGSMVSVAGGKVSKMMPKEEDPMKKEIEEAEVVYTKDALDAIIKEEVTKALAEQKAEFEKAKSEMNEAVMNFKKTVTLGIAPKKAAFKTPEIPEALTFNQMILNKMKTKN